MIIRAKKISYTFSLLFVLCLSLNIQARHLKLYTYDVLNKGITAITYNLDIVKTPAGDPNFGTPILHELEFEHGFSSKWTQSFYIDYDNLSGKVNEITSLKTEINYAFGKKGRDYFDFRLNIEYAKSMNNHVDAYDSRDTADTIEFRPIFEKNFNHFSVVIGPILSKDLYAPNNATLVECILAFANAIMFSLSEKFGANLELHSFVTDKQHYFVPNIDYAISDNFTVFFAPGIGLTSLSDKFTCRFSAAITF